MCKWLLCIDSISWSGDMTYCALILLLQTTAVFGGGEKGIGNTDNRFFYRGPANVKAPYGTSQQVYVDPSLSKDYDTQSIYGGISEFNRAAEIFSPQVDRSGYGRYNSDVNIPVQPTPSFNVQQRDPFSYGVQEPRNYANQRLAPVTTEIQRPSWGGYGNRQLPLSDYGFTQNRGYNYPQVQDSSWGGGYQNYPPQDYRRRAFSPIDYQQNKPDPFSNRFRSSWPEREILPGYDNYGSSRSWDTGTGEYYGQPMRSDWASQIKVNDPYLEIKRRQLRPPPPPPPALRYLVITPSLLERWKSIKRDEYEEDLEESRYKPLSVGADDGMTSEELAEEARLKAQGSSNVDDWGAVNRALKSPSFKLGKAASFSGNKRLDLDVQDIKDNPQVGNAAWHGSAVTRDELEFVKRKLGRNYTPVDASLEGVNFWELLAKLQAEGEGKDDPNEHESWKEYRKQHGSFAQSFSKLAQPEPSARAEENLNVQKTDLEYSMPSPQLLPEPVQGEKVNLQRRDSGNFESKMAPERDNVWSSTQSVSPSIQEVPRRKPLPQNIPPLQVDRPRRKIERIMAGRPKL